MKKHLILLIFTSLFALSVSSQVQFFTFESAGDKFILSNASEVEGSITISPNVEGSISTIVIGTEYIVQPTTVYTVKGNFTKLNVSNNQLLSLDVSGLNSLTFLNCSHNLLEQLSLVELGNLERLDCSNNQLFSLDLSGLIKLKRLDCNINFLKKLDLYDLQGLKRLNCSSNLLSLLDISGEKSLTRLNCSHNSLLNIKRDENMPAPSALVDGKEQKIYIPMVADANGGYKSDNHYDVAGFHSFLILDPGSITFENGYFKSPGEMNEEKSFTTNLAWGNEKLLKGTLVFYTEQSFKFISNSNMFMLKEENTVATGIISISPAVSGSNGNANSIIVGEEYTILPNVEYTVSGGFTKLSPFAENQITSLDVSQMTNLTYLYCAKNELTDLDVSNLINLETLDCGPNSLTSLDVSNLTKLRTLNCGGNDFSETGLDISGLNYLKRLDCHLSNLNTLDIPAPINLSWLRCSSNDLTVLDVSNQTSLRTLMCFENRISVLELSHHPELVDLQCFKNYIDGLNLSNSNKLENLDCSNNNLNTLKLPSGSSVLKNLECFNNNLTKLKIYGSQALEVLTCAGNKLLEIEKESEMPGPKRQFLAGGQRPIISMIPDPNGGYISANDYEFNEVHTFDIAGNTVIFDENKIKTTSQINQVQFTTDLNWETPPYTDPKLRGTIILKYPSVNSLNTKNPLIPEDSSGRDYSPSDIESFDLEKSISIYPNPVQNGLCIKSSDEILNVSVLDINGKLLTNENGNGHFMSLSVSQLKSGFYVVRVQTVSESRNFKITKE